MGRWDEFSVNWVRQILFDGQAVTLENPHDKGEFLVQTENRIQTITPGTARGRILGGNLTVLTAIMNDRSLRYSAVRSRRSSAPTSVPAPRRASTA